MLVSNQSIGRCGVAGQSVCECLRGGLTLSVSSSEYPLEAGAAFLPTENDDGEDAMTIVEGQTEDGAYDDIDHNDDSFEDFSDEDQQVRDAAVMSSDLRVMTSGGRWRVRGLEPRGPLH